MKKKTHILILEKPTPFRDRLKAVCAEVGKAWVADDLKMAQGLISRRSFRLLLLDWDLIRTDLADLSRVLDIFQPHARRIALFTAPQLHEVVAAMKSGMDDVLWLAQNSSVLRDKLTASLAAPKPVAAQHFHIPQLTRSLAERAASKKISLIAARKEFSKTFLNQVLLQKRMRKFQLANLMNVATRTLRRHLMK